MATVHLRGKASAESRWHRFRVDMGWDDTFKDSDRGWEVVHSPSGLECCSYHRNGRNKIVGKGVI